MKNQKTEEGKQSKPMTLKDYHRETLLRGEIPGALSETGNNQKTHAQEQQELKNALKSAIAAADSTSHDDELLEVRVKSQEEQDQEQQQYRQWLLKTLKSDKTVASSEEIQKWSDIASTNQVNDDEQFLMK